MTAINAEVNKNPNENPVSLLRRFTKRVQGTQVLNRARSIRFYSRPASKLVKREQALKRIKRHTEVTRLKKLGKIPS
jgi:ribosomal protein S21